MAISSLMSAHTVAPRDGMSTTGFDVMAVSAAVAAIVTVPLLAMLCLPTYLGKTRICNDGLLIAKPCRRMRFLPWTSIDAIRVDAVSYGRGRPEMGLRASMGDKGLFLPGVLVGNSDFERSMKTIVAAWRRANPDAAARVEVAYSTTYSWKQTPGQTGSAAVAKKTDPNKNRARSRRPHTRRP